MKRKLISILALLLVTASLLALPAAAAESAYSESTVSPRYVNIRAFTASIDISSSGKAECYTYIKTANSSYSITVNMVLQRYVNDSWTTVKSWTSSGTGSLIMDKSYYITGDYYYRTGAAATIRDENGAFIETATIASQSCYYAN